MKDFRDKVAVVTGSASGIGLEIARELGRRGARIVMSDVEQGSLTRVVDEVTAGGVDAVGVVADVSDRAAVERLADQAWDRFGTVDLVVHNAGVVVFAPLVETTEADWTWLINVNLWGPINGISVFLKRMLATGKEGHMLFTSSAGGLTPFAGTSAYCTTKAGVTMLAESLALELRDTPLGVSVLCPMSVATNIITSNRNRPGTLGGSAANREAVDSRKGGQFSSVVSAEDAANIALDGIIRGDLYIHTHKEEEARVTERTGLINSTFQYSR